MPKLAQAQSMLDESASERLIHQAISIVFFELERYQKIMTMFEGMEFSAF